MDAASITHGWETQIRSRKPWSMVPEANKATMRGAVKALLDAMTKADARMEAAEAIRQQMPRARLWVHSDRVKVVRTVLDAVGYPAHESSDEGTCWCPVAEQAGRERDAAREEADRLAALVEHLEAEGPHRPCVHGRCGEA